MARTRVRLLRDSRHTGCYMVDNAGCPSEARLAVLTSLTVTFGLATVGFGVLAFQGGRQHKRALATLINQGVQND